MEAGDATGISRPEGNPASAALASRPCSCELIRLEWKMSRKIQPRETARDWLTGVIVMTAVAVSFIGFSTVSVKITILVSTAILVGLVAFFWVIGKRKRQEVRRSASER